METDVLHQIELDIAVTSEPFAAIAKGMDTTEEEIILAILKGIDEKMIRRFGAVVNHIEAGYESNALVVFCVPEEKIDIAGAAAAEFPFVSHCYRREPRENWPYNLYAMVHAKSEEESLASIERLKEAVVHVSPSTTFKALKTIKELKKTSFKP